MGEIRKADRDEIGITKRERECEKEKGKKEGQKREANETV